MKLARLCKRSGCGKEACATLTFDYAGSTAVLGPLAPQATPQAYDLCHDHASSLSVPKGWQVVRLENEWQPAPASVDDIEALANAIREVSSRPTHRPKPNVGYEGSALQDQNQEPSPTAVAGMKEVARKGHLRVLKNAPGEPEQTGQMGE